MYEYVPLDDPGCSLTRILRQPSAVGWLLDGKQSQWSTTTEELGLPAHCPGIDVPDPLGSTTSPPASVIPWERDLPAPGPIFACDTNFTPNSFLQEHLSPSQGRDHDRPPRVRLVHPS